MDTVTFARMREEPHIERNLEHPTRRIPQQTRLVYVRRRSVTEKISKTFLKIPPCSYSKQMLCASIRRYLELTIKQLVHAGLATTSTLTPAVAHFASAFPCSAMIGTFLAMRSRRSIP